MLVFDDIFYRYESSRDDALRGFSLTLERGCVLALLGANGSGKSTALGIGASWLKPRQGSFSADGMVAFLPQSERFSFSFSCLEYVSFGRAPHMPYLSLPSACEDTLALEALRRVGMESRLHRRITSLSGGEMQLVRLARALAQDAPYLLLDEPGDMLDPGHAASVGVLLRELAGEGRGILFSTHDIAFALSHADDAALVRDGRAVKRGSSAGTLSVGELSMLYGHPFALASIPVPYL